jgi:hypothetical protein
MKPIRLRIGLSGIDGDIDWAIDVKRATGAARCPSAVIQAGMAGK